MTRCPICQSKSCGNRCIALGSSALEFIGLAELVGERIPQPEVIEASGDYAWRAWDAAVAAQDARAGR